MAWSGSAVFRAFVADQLSAGLNYDLDAAGTNGYKAALYNNSITPDKDATAANTAYNAGQWANTNEVYQAGQWAQGGVAISGRAVSTPSTGVVQFAGNNVSSGSAATLSNIYGVLVYNDDGTPKRGVSYNYLGGLNSVSNGTFTVVWHSNGIFRFTV